MTSPIGGVAGVVVITIRARAASVIERKETLISELQQDIEELNAFRVWMSAWTLDTASGRFEHSDGHTIDEWIVLESSPNPTTPFLDMFRRVREARS